MKKLCLLVLTLPFLTSLFLENLSSFPILEAYGKTNAQERVSSGSSSRYNRKFFEHWIDSDGDCQNTRAEILMEQSDVPVTFRKSKKGNCSVLKGSWKDFYYAEVLTDASKVDIDHVVPLKHAWDIGANLWTREKRERFANDPLNLVITNRKYNRQKGAKTILEWMPIDRNYACKYARRWMQIKEKYDLPLSSKEREYVDLLKCKP